MEQRLVNFLPIIAYYRSNDICVQLSLSISSFESKQKSIYFYDLPLYIGMSSLEAQVDLLASLIERLDTIREISAGNLPVHLRSAITNVSSLAEELASSQVQNALAAAETEQGIRTVDLQNSRRDIRKRK